MSEDPVTLLQNAARAHVPVDPNHKGKEPETFFPVPDPHNRQSITEIMAGIQKQDWYTGQICFEKTFEGVSGIHGESTLCSEMHARLNKLVRTSYRSDAFRFSIESFERVTQYYYFLLPPSLRHQCSSKSQTCYCVYEYGFRKERYLSSTIATHPRSRSNCHCHLRVSD